MLCACFRLMTSCVDTLVSIRLDKLVCICIFGYGYVNIYIYIKVLVFGVNIMKAFEIMVSLVYTLDMDI